MGKLDSLKKYLSVARAAEYLSKKLNEEVTRQDIAEIILSHELKISVRLSENVFAKRDLAPTVLDSTSSPLPNHPIMYYQEDLHKISRLKMVTLRPQTLEVAMIHTDYAAIKNLLWGTPLNKLAFLSFPITLVDPLKETIYYLYQPLWIDNDDGHQYCERTDLPSNSELVISTQELNRLVEALTQTPLSRCLGSLKNLSKLEGFAEFTGIENYDPLYDSMEIQLPPWEILESSNDETLDVNTLDDLEANSGESTKKEQQADNPSEEILLKMIFAFSHFMMGKNKKYSYSNKPNRRAISETLRTIAEEKGVSIKGLSKSRVSDAIAASENLEEVGLSNVSIEDIEKELERALEQN